MKTCSRCKMLLNEIDFNWKKQNVRKSSYCKKCSRLYIKEHYLSHRKYYLDKAKKRNEFVRSQTCNLIKNYLLLHPCIDCGENDLNVLEFDHKDPAIKIDTVSHIIQRKLSQQKLLDEMSKCDIRCANCHRKKTNRENNSWKSYLAPVA